MLRMGMENYLALIPVYNDHLGYHVSLGRIYRRILMRRANAPHAIKTVISIYIF